MKTVALNALDIASITGGRIIGDADRNVDGAGALEHATESQLSFLSNPKMSCLLASTKSRVVIVREGDVKPELPVTWIVVENPYLAYAKISGRFAKDYLCRGHIHPSAVIAEEAVIGEGVTIGANAVVEPGATIEQSAIIGAGCYIGHEASVGAGTRLHANVSVYPRVIMGRNCIIHSGAVIGADGFGMANEGGKWIKISQLGTVILGDDVEIGANTTIDCGALENTIIESGVKIDNMCHLAHNVHVGENTAMAGFSAIAGSTKVGKNCMIAGGAGIIGHAEIADRVTVTARTFVNATIKESGAVVSSGTVMQDTKDWRKSVNRFKKLDDMYRRLIRLEKQIKKLENDNDE